MALISFQVLLSSWIQIQKNSSNERSWVKNMGWKSWQFSLAVERKDRVNFYSFKCHTWRITARINEQYLYHGKATPCIHTAQQCSLRRPSDTHKGFGEWTFNGSRVSPSALTWASHALTHQKWLGRNGATSRCFSLTKALGRADVYSHPRKACTVLSGHLHIWSECERFVKNGIFIGMFSFSAFPCQPGSRCSLIRHVQK